ncbi:metalloprotease TIKI2-like [Hippocampus comes]|uniref:metalloprotease TIKI2-like n=1 Tax=Hippocampus comes TaxID=109280 RepID=UPI00094EC7FD|nr:PREDICTED: metalloprotease TIKI2-like [Hippocampus comes]
MCLFNSQPDSEPTSGTSMAPPTGLPTSSGETELDEPHSVPGIGEEEEEEELTHILQPDSLSQLEEFGRHKRGRKVHRGHGRPRLFSDLWVRFGDGTALPPNVRIINGYVTVEPPLTRPEDHVTAPPSSTPSGPTSAQAPSWIHNTPSLTCAFAWLLSYVLLIS